MPDNICKIINNELWWSQLQELSQLLLPYCACLNKLQCDKARLYEVVHCVSYLIKLYKGYSNQNFATNMIKRLEHRWNSWEQPLLLLSFFLHPKYGISVFSSINEQLYFQLSDWLIYYYCAWFGNEPHTLLPELEKYRKGEKPFTERVTNQFNNNIMGYWEYCTTSAKELGKVACHIFGICVNSASVERLFSCMGWLHNKSRSRLKV